MISSYASLRSFNCNCIQSTAPPINLRPTPANTTTLRFWKVPVSIVPEAPSKKNIKPKTKIQNSGHTCCSSCVTVFGNADGLMAQVSWVSRRTLDHLLIWAAYLTAPCSSRYWWRATHGVDKMVLMSRPRGVNQHSNRGKLGFPIRIRATQLVLSMESKVIFFKPPKKTS